MRTIGSAALMGAFTTIAVLSIEAFVDRNYYAWWVVFLAAFGLPLVILPLLRILVES